MASQTSKAHTRIASFAAIGGLLVATPVAEASTLTNRDSTSYEIAVVENRATKVYILKPRAVLEDFCKTGCVIRINGDVDDEYELEGKEAVMLKGGLVYYDGPRTPEAAARRDHANGR